jgi:phosphonate transport system ATP-binding protein
VTAALLRVQGLTKHYARVAAIEDVTLTVHAGEVVALLGPSGAGKSTIFRCLTALTPADAGDVHVLERPVRALGRRELLETRRAIGLIFQQFNLIGRLSAIDNVLAGRLGHVSTLAAALRWFSPADRGRALAALDRVGLLDRAYQRADRLSGGQQQRVAIARVLAQESRIILADEPVSSLDPQSAHNVLGTLREVARERGLAVLCSLHQVDFARGYADRIIGLRSGRVHVALAAAAFDDVAMTAVYGPSRGKTHEGGRASDPSLPPSPSLVTGAAAP